jgi:hypothetical protein
VLESFDCFPCESKLLRRNDGALALVLRGGGVDERAFDKVGKEVDEVGNEDDDDSFTSFAVSSNNLSNSSMVASISVKQKGSDKDIFLSFFLSFLFLFLVSLSLYLFLFLLLLYFLFFLSFFPLRFLSLSFILPFVVV